MKYYFAWLAFIWALILAGCGFDDMSDISPKLQGVDNHNTENHNNQDTSDGLPEQTDHTADWIGPLEPEVALEYMKTTYHQGLVIVDVTPEEYKLETGFTGSIHIPYTELETRSDEIPSSKPVILHCVRGKSSAKAYPILEEKRKDIPVLSYIAGEPLIEEFNTWLESQRDDS